MSDAIAIAVENLTKVYKLYSSPIYRLKEALSPIRQKYHRDFHALNDVSFEVKKGEAVGIIGKNGSGKSTLLKIITGVLTPTSGSVSVNGRISALLELGAGFNPEMTGLENVYFSGTLMGYSREEMDARLDGILSFADIGEFVSQPVKTYSSGMFVRLAFAVAINVDPDILIVDEALSVGDIKYQRKCISKIEEFKEKNKTILFVSHDAGMISNLCKTAILINNGKVVSRDEPRVVSKLYMQMMYGEDLACEDASLLDQAQKNGYYKESLSAINNSERLQLRTAALKKIGFISKKASCELRHGNGDAEIIDFGILDDGGNRLSRIKSNKKYTLFFYLLCYEDIKEIFLAFAIRDKRGMNLFVTNTEIMQIRVSNQNKGSLLYVTVVVTMALVAGDYFMSCIAMDNVEDMYLDRRLDVFHFNVIPSDIKCKGVVNLSPSMQYSAENIAGSL